MQSSRSPVDWGCGCEGGSIINVGLWIVQVLLVLSGLPQGVQLIGGLYREDLCLDAAAAIEKRLGNITPTEPRSYPSTDHR
jgi:hypothetical protein